jgi:putative sigma-54 modulation protein
MDGTHKEQHSTEVSNISVPTGGTTMRLQIHTKNFRLHDTDREEMERRLQFALNRFDGRISQVTVGLADLNGPRGGTDKQCRLVVRLAPSGKVTIEETHANVSAAVALAADRAGRAVGRELERRRDARHHRRSRASFSDCWEQSVSSCAERQ